MNSLTYKTSLITRRTGAEDHFTVKKDGSVEVDVPSTDSLQTNQKEKYSDGSM